MNNKLLHYTKALQWIFDNNSKCKGINVTSADKKIYPEVTGYFIPSLLKWGMSNLALSFARYLCLIQKSDGSWYDYSDSNPYVFDSAQILKGLLSIRKIMPEVDGHIIKGCDWILSNMQ